MLKRRTFLRFVYDVSQHSWHSWALSLFFSFFHHSPTERKTDNHDSSDSEYGEPSLYTLSSFISGVSLDADCFSFHWFSPIQIALIIKTLPNQTKTTTSNFIEWRQKEINKQRRIKFNESFTMEMSSCSSFSCRKRPCKVNRTKCSHPFKWSNSRGWPPENGKSESVCWTKQRHGAQQLNLRNTHAHSWFDHLKNENSDCVAPWFEFRFGWNVFFSLLTWNGFYLYANESV